MPPEKRSPFLAPIKPGPAEELESCCICILEYEDDDILVETQCGHLFHEECLKCWVRTKLSARFA